MRILPVLDLMHGQVVRGVGGRRHEYRPVESRLTSSAEPLAIARAFRKHFGFDELYLADLDAIAGAPPALGAICELQDNGFRLLVDAGLRATADAVPLLTAGVGGVIAGLETVAGPEAFAGLVAGVGAQRLVFSLDLKDGRPLAAADWPAEPWAIALAALAAGAARFLVLDLARVGTGAGTGTEDLCRRLRRESGVTELLAGGGVRGADDLRRLRDSGVDGVLVASALHDGRLTRADLAPPA
jgi:phosphoribosylformimino-5-aminoimidazole carboxamide ribotide isomerase